MTLRQRLPFLLPLLIFVVLAVFLVRRLELNDQGITPDIIPSAMIDQPAPSFTLPSLFDGQPKVTTESLKGHVTLINIFASWCVPCRAEHTLLPSVKAAGVRLVGINYKNKPADARAWLEQVGNPYDAIVSDMDGRTGIDFGVYGVPESYLLDKQGIIRYKQIGPLTREALDKTILPMALELNK